MRSTLIKLAVFVAVTATLTAVLGAVIGNYNPFRRTYGFEAVFEDATGLLRNDIVTLAGVDVGKVTSLRVEDGYGVIGLQVEDKVRIPVTSRILIRFRNLLGQRMVVLQPEGSGDFIEEGHRVPPEQTDGPVDLGTVFNNLRPLVKSIDAEDVNTLSKTLVESFGAHQDDLDAILADTAKVTAELAERDDKVASLVSGIEETAGALAEEKEQLRALISSYAEITGTLAGRSAELDRTILNLDQATGDFGRLIAGNRPALDRDLQDLATLLALVAAHQQDVGQIASKLDDTLRASARATTYGEWANLYIFSLCEASVAGCRAPAASSSSLSDERRPGLAGFLYAPVEGSS